MEKSKVTLDDFTMLTMIGFGNYAKVILVRRKQSGRLYAMKIIKKIGQVQALQKDHAYIEKEILLECKHPFIVKIHSSFQLRKKLYFILQYCPGGELFSIIKRCKRLNQESSKFYAAQILLCLQYLHHRKIIYRDLKPQNVLIDLQGYIRIVDFGVSVLGLQTQPRYNISVLAGTPEYLPPQSFNKDIKLNFSLDWWGFGTLIFQMIAGFPPFFTHKQNFLALKQKILTQQPPLHLISNPILKDLLSKLLQKNPQKRLGSNGAKEVKEHPWFKMVPWEKILDKTITAPFIPHLKSDIDTIWFDLESFQGDSTNLSQEGDKQSQKYQSFSLSWKSSDKAPSEIHDASPPQITLKIEQSEN